MSIRIVPISLPDRPHLSPDLVWSGEAGDIELAGAGDAAGGLSATRHLESAITIALMTDRRVEADELRDGDVNRGWPGDAFDMDEGDAPLGSRLWLLRRRAVNETQTPRLAEDYAREALQPLIDCGAVARFDISAGADPAHSRLDLAIVATNRDGATVVAPKYQIHWR